MIYTSIDGIKIKEEFHSINQVGNETLTTVENADEVDFQDLDEYKLQLIVDNLTTEQK